MIFGNYMAENPFPRIGGVKLSPNLTHETTKNHATNRVFHPQSHDFDKTSSLLNHTEQNSYKSDSHEILCPRVIFDVESKNCTKKFFQPIFGIHFWDFGIQ